MQIHPVAIKVNILAIICVILPFGIASYAAVSDAEISKPIFSENNDSVYLKFINNDNLSGDETAPKLFVSFPDGAEREVVVDTGSTGLVISSSAIPNANNLSARPGKITYNSSGRIMIGSWLNTTLTIGDGEKFVSTNIIPVLAVNEIQCLAKARNCKPELNPEHVSMMGIGFDRESSLQSESTPNTNPLLNTKSGSNNGYTLTRNGIYVGINKDTAKGFSFIKLQPSNENKHEWIAPPACIKITGWQGYQCGTVLIDTGVKSMFLTIPNYSVNGGQLPNGTTLNIKLAEGIEYEIITGGHKTNISPKEIFLNTTRQQIFVNTGFNFLNRYDILYDYENGYFGYKDNISLP
ncbi:TPA: hypothetical protein R5X31_000969 [Enterobacter cloacae]|uniref:PE cleavage protein A C-terminal domain-containing protein n=15 Tax=Enterobacteriaceae TaxID=543 RepID=A0A2I7YUD3_ENTCL|nr:MULTISPECIES: hypothetical protein [Enterobacter]HED6240545.1 hypothetical protein [Enterobacter sichuanensis]AUS83609.1 hypothetical protein [Enterobacter cloacae]EKX8547293.1 hypothetical protein [Enterobacter bugandensis]EKX8549711.1 hypothetical protein [Enterobacter bugandensis]MDO2440348.1 hypothetical protein [Enterobacter nematophilus]